MEGEPEAYRDDTLRSIGISPRERLERIEKMLETIDGKLDGKVDMTEFVKLETRVDGLHRDHENLKNRMAWLAGALAVGAILGEYIIGRIISGG